MEDSNNNPPPSLSDKTLLSDNWCLFKTEANRYQSPADFNFAKQDLLKTCVPGTVAMAINLKQPDCWTPPIDYDEFDWWYQIQFDCKDIATHQFLILEGLATLVDVWLNDQLLLSSDNMFHHHKIDVEKILNKGANTLTLHFKSLACQLNQRHSRPRWKTRLVSQQALRWFRTTLLGRIPGWTPPVSAVGPWKPVYLLDKSTPVNIDLKTSVKDSEGVIDFNCELSCKAQSIQANLQIDEIDYPLEVTKNDAEDTIRLAAQIKIPEVNLWWPHTHGEPHLYQAKLVIKLDNQQRLHNLGSIGFRSIELSEKNDDFKLTVNHQAIFCRGACWTVNDIISLKGNSEQLQTALTLMRDAGANMIRIGGTMVYEQDEFYQLCDELGLLVWQDFMFANMDYPFDNQAFLQSVNTEIQQQLQRLSKHVSIAVYCGNSEIQQQVAMLGFEQSVWEISFFEESLPKLCNDIHPNSVYVSSSPKGGHLPFSVNQGLSHYYGVGAYLKPVSELRQHNVKFTSECLGFSNIPTAKTRNSVLDGDLPMTHNPLWKQRTPRDSGTGWDFEDVRDHYFKQLFNLDATHMRSFDPDKYIQLSEIVTGEIMSQVFQEWRSSYSQCNGGLVWFMKDLWSGAGWGIIDSQNNPKACYYYLKRAWRPVSISVTDETLDGLHLHLTNESQKTFSGTIQLDLINKASNIIANLEKQVMIPANTTVTFSSDELLDRFYDVTYSYRFGPAKHYLVSARLIDLKQHLIDEAIYFPTVGLPDMVYNSIKLAVNQLDEKTYQVSLQSEKFVYSVNLDIPGFIAEDNFFHLIPHQEKTVMIYKSNLNSKPLKGYISAINLPETIRLKI